MSDENKRKGPSIGDLFRALAGRPSAPEEKRPQSDAFDPWADMPSRFAPKDAPSQEEAAYDMERALAVLEAARLIEMLSGGTGRGRAMIVDLRGEDPFARDIGRDNPLARNPFARDPFSADPFADPYGRAERRTPPVSHFPGCSTDKPLPATTEPELYGTELQGETSMVLHARPDVRLYDFNALALYINDMRDTRRLPYAVEDHGDAVILDGFSVAQIANNTNGAVHNAAEQAYKDLVRMEREGYHAGLFMHYRLEHSFTHQNRGAESVFCNFHAAPITALAANDVLNKEQRMPTHINLFELLSGVMPEGMSASPAPGAGGKPLEVGDLLRFAGKAHRAAPALWHEHRIESTPSLSIQAHK